MSTTDPTKCSDCGGVCNWTLDGYDQHGAIRELACSSCGKWMTGPEADVTDQPEPTVGQLIDAMHQEIERTCERMGWTLLAVDLQSGFNPSKHQTSIQILGRGWIDCTGDTPQAALRAMIERLREIK